jgi:uncharacterized protein (DUF433 family)
MLDRMPRIPRPVPVLILLISGLGVWEIIRDYHDVKGNEKKLKTWLPHISSAQLKAAILYYARFRQEVDAEIAENSAAHAEGWALGFGRRASGSWNVTPWDFAR